MSAPADLTPDARSARDLDRTLHEPARLQIVAALYPLETADFLYLARNTGLSKGNLSSHLLKLEAAGYVDIEKTYRGRIPLTLCRLTDGGRDALQRYREQIRRLADELPGPGSRRQGERAGR